MMYCPICGKPRDIIIQPGSTYTIPCPHCKCETAVTLTGAPSLTPSQQFVDVFYFGGLGTGMQNYTGLQPGVLQAAQQQPLQAYVPFVDDPIAYSYSYKVIPPPPMQNAAINENDSVKKAVQDAAITAGWAIPKKDETPKQVAMTQYNEWLWQEEREL